MNVILILIDSLNRHFLSPYASDADTPNVQRLAERGWRFDRHFVGSLPCVPARRELIAGFQELLWRPWGSLEPYDARMPVLLAESGYRTGLVTDHYHYWEEPGNGYLQSFQSTDLIRGQQADNWRLPIDRDAPAPGWVKSIEKWKRGNAARRYYGNVRDFSTEEDFFAARVMTRATRWLDENVTRRPFYLQVELYDVHEPFRLPEPYASMYWERDDRENYTVWPPYQQKDEARRFAAEASPDEKAFIRAQYRGGVKMMDRWLGALLDKLDELALWDDTVVLFTTDHGHDLCERGVYGKRYPNYDSHALIPLLLWHPGLPGRGSVDALTTTVDLFATVLDIAGLPVPEGTHGRSVLPLLAGDRRNARDGILYGLFGEGLCYTDAEWTLFKGPEDDGPLYYYSTSIYKSLLAQYPDGRVPPVDSGYFIPGVRLPQWKVPMPMAARTRDNFLFHRATDPRQQHNVWNERPADRQRLLHRMCDLMESHGAPDEQYKRLGLVASRSRAPVTTPRTSKVASE
jgi:arylsulfatase A-like enzyme